MMSESRQYELIVDRWRNPTLSFIDTDHMILSIVNGKMSDGRVVSMKNSSCTFSNKRIPEIDQSIISTSYY
jgi:hypothetical protein